MEPSSRTPEGEPNRCPVCHNDVQIDPSRPPGDAPCPYCGHLLWFGPTQSFDEEEPAKQVSGVLELVELAQQKFDKEELPKQEARLRKGEFTLVDFQKLIAQTKKLGPIRKILSMLPGMGDISKMFGDLDADKDMRRLMGIIDSMTPAERHNPSGVIDESRRRRVAEGAGVQSHDVNALLTQFEPMADLMKSLSGMGMRDRIRKMRELGRGGDWPFQVR